MIKIFNKIYSFVAGFTGYTTANAVFQPFNPDFASSIVRLTNLLG
ncbi:hypothetical protein FDUTEX481_02453 [Tolypothrix sp. PCC 7601]|nr:hypothetical protein FDUTEX481_02453 [Tolypothrix sp. PCC 7601]